MINALCKFFQSLDNGRHLIYNYYIKIERQDRFMSKWDDFKSGIENFAGKTADMTRELTGSAAIKIKIANKEADRDREYKLLGKLAYAKLKKLNVSDAAELTQKISDTLAKLDKILAELNALKQKEEEMKAAKEAEKVARAAARKAREEAEYAEDVDDEDELNTVIMDEFNEARKDADAAYENAKKNADDVK
jgi:hypothetical protein